MRSGKPVEWDEPSGGTNASGEGSPPGYDAFFERATGNPPLPYQRELATAKELYRLVRVPTGLGKTQAIIAAWCWRRRFGAGAIPAATPRRLVYCLPMRVLVEQTREVAASFLEKVGLGDDVRVHVLMGGEDVAADDWDTHPEADAILIGTQDMLLSRALNRGYAMNRYRWPMHFALLNEDCLWIVDEPQLFGAGLSTTAQLTAFRRRFGTHAPTATIWASATLEPHWLQTVDVRPAVDCAPELVLGDEDAKHPVVRKRLGAEKRVHRAEIPIGDLERLVTLVLREHRAGTRTLVVVNTVKRARELHALLRAPVRVNPTGGKGKARKKGAGVEVFSQSIPPAVLVHSRFRPGDRTARVFEALECPGPLGTVVVSTQVIEAGVDLSCATLITELAPWASIVQRLGRCNRRGEDADARVFWCPLPTKPQERKAAALPYELAELERADAALAEIRDGSPGGLAELGIALGEPPPTQVVRAKDLIELFDTTPDLSGADVDVSRFIRDGDERDVHVFWRAFDKLPRDQAAPHRAELCAAPIGELKEFLESNGHRPWRWDLLERRWVAADRIVPGMALLLHSETGGYTPERGWDPAVSDPVAAIDRAELEGTPAADRSDDDDPLSRRQCLSLSQHSTDTAREAEKLVAALATALPAAARAAVVRAARWHDVGKAHPVFQDTLRRSGCSTASGLLAKSPGNARHSRPGFRHELASALAALAHGETDLIAYLLAAHHGKVRLRIRSQPNETRPDDVGRLFARGVWDGDELGEVDLGNGERVPPTVLRLDYMRLGGSEHVGASWTARVTALRDHPAIGPFRLAFLETLVRVADERASGDPGADA